MNKFLVAISGILTLILGIFLSRRNQVEQTAKDARLEERQANASATVEAKKEALDALVKEHAQENTKDLTPEEIQNYWNKK